MDLPNNSPYSLPPAMIELSECLREISMRSASFAGAFSAPCWSATSWRSCRFSAERGLDLAKSSAVTLIVALAAVAAFASDGETALLEGSRVAISDGQWWRVFTGHVTHWSGDHLAWDLFMFVVLGVTLEHRNRKRYLALLVASAATISASVFLLQSNIASYRGLSGVDSALFVAVCANLLVDARRDERRVPRRADPSTVVATFLFAGFIGKTIFEYATGDTLFVASNAAGFTPLPLAHVAGAAAAVCLAAYYPLRGSLAARRQRRRHHAPNQSNRHRRRHRPERPPRRANRPLP